MTPRHLSRVLGALVVLAPAALHAQATTKATPAKPAAAGTAATAAKPASLPSAHQIVDRYVKAIGGREAILKHSSMKSTGTFEIPAAGLKADVESYAMKPNLIYVKITLPGMGEIVQGFDGTTAWEMNPNTGPRVLAGKELTQMQQRADFTGELHDSANYSVMETVEQTTFEGRPAYKVRLVRKGGDETFEYFDTETALMLGSTSTVETQMGQIAVTNLRQDYKDQGGVLSPTTMVQRAGGQEFIIRSTSVEWDTVKAEAFALPPQIKALVPAR